MLGIGRKRQGEPSVINRVSDNFGWLFGGSGTAPALTNTTALSSTAVLACVRAISEGVAQTPIRLIETFEENGLERTRVAKSHTAHKLMQRPNSFQTTFEFIEGMVANAVLGKGALAIKVQVGSEVRELLPVPSGVWTMEMLSDSSYQFRVQFTDGSQQVFNQKQVLFFRGLSLDGYSSVSAIEAARNAVGISSGLETASLRAATSGGRPSGILSFADGMTPETKEKLRETWQTRYSAGGEGGIAVLDGNTTFTAMNMTAADSQFLENRKFQTSEICRIFRVSPALVFDEGQKIDATAMRFHITNTLMPWMKRFEQALNRDLLNGDTRYHWDFDEFDLLRADFREMGDFVTKMLGAGGQNSVLSLNECRIELGFDPIDEEYARKPSRGGYEISGGGVKPEPELDDEGKPKEKVEV